MGAIAFVGVKMTFFLNHHMPSLARQYPHSHVIRERSCRKEQPSLFAEQFCEAIFEFFDGSPFEVNVGLSVARCKNCQRLCVFDGRQMHAINR